MPGKLQAIARKHLEIRETTEGYRLIAFNQLGKSLQESCRVCVVKKVLIGSKAWGRLPQGNAISGENSLNVCKTASISAKTGRFSSGSRFG
jgi:hypothetical protein